eukprot:5856509-Prymnesium_polylepis.1
MADGAHPCWITPVPPALAGGKPIACPNSEIIPLTYTVTAQCPARVSFPCVASLRPGDGRQDMDHDQGARPRKAKGQTPP